ncbi:glycine--tRNA ligase subunit beta [Alteraurantiacibacter aquimixticola]|uniref:Glycine--tRNA ligase beta subunit n=1 Tax=Alteraurantiacibacter aquimixticola TaxID=2489173 RepID=A0A4T3F0P9_9SPHN|nr:glycine--tRNA ligase subunit beta [Alteraurantiacibacter aquimixticola]TIX50107.1 glycine--tRNA ligase subunit beta [Alteraurantiacibacter aquimixticola]
MSDFLLELRSEEIPARMQKGAREELEKLFRREMEAAGVAVGELTVWSTPRRLALIARDLPEATEPVSEEAKGPPVGAPDQALDGFCRKNGVTRDDLEVRDVKGRETYFAVKNIPGRATRDLLAEAIPAIIRDFSWPKSMRWGADSVTTESLRWVRPLSGIVALLGDDVVECEVHGVTSGAVTLGHRFHHSGDITIGNADDYAVKLRAAHVIVDHEERQDTIRAKAAEAATAAGLKLVEDEGLVIENAGLTEWPVPLLGRFDEDFLGVPPEVIQLTARVNQKYFVCEKPDGSLADAFVCTANIEAVDPAVVVDGNRKVLAARLSDARFFWDVDRKTKLSDHATKLERITFHEKLGTVADKVERVAKLARWLVEEKIVTPAQAGVQGGSDDQAALDSRLRGNDEEVAKLADQAEQAARLCKADLVTEMVGEFPELQGLMGGYYARAEGLPDAVANAIRDHYKPVGQGDDVPTAPVTVAVSLADKLDTLVGFFIIGEHPTGSKDPFALRRAMLGILRTIIENEMRFGISEPFQIAMAIQIQNVAWQEAIPFEEDFWAIQSRDFAERIRPSLAEAAVAAKDAKQRELIEAGLLNAKKLDSFLGDRLKVQQREAGVRHDLIDAVFALGGEDDLVRLLARVHALQAFVETEDGENLLAGYKRAANILKKEEWLGFEGEIAQTGEEDPLAEVDDPLLKDVVAEKMAMRHKHELPYTPEPAEKALIDALAEAQPRAAEAIAQEDFAAAMSALASLRAPIDAFFDEVTVNDEDAAKRGHRLDLLAQFRVAVHNVADFSKIEG